MNEVNIPGSIHPTTQMLSIIGSLILFLIVIILVRKGILKSSYSLLWFIVSTVIFIMSVFADVLTTLSTLAGIYYPTAAIFAVLIVGIILIMIHFSVVISRQEKRIRKLAQENSLLKNKIKKQN